MMNNAFLPRVFLGCECSLEQADVVLFGAPFDGTVTFRPGARFAPQAIRTDSVGLETYSPYLDLDLTDHKVHDAGDLDLPFGSPQAALAQIEHFAEQLFASGKKPLMIGGEHLVSLPVLQRAAAAYPQLRVLHFDAHTDLRTDYLGHPLSHSTVIRHVWEQLGDGRIFQFGIRSGTKEEFDWAAQGHTSLCKFDFSALEQAVKAIGNHPVYLTFDLDVLDPSVLPGTGTPEAGGVTFGQVMETFSLLRGLNWVGADLVELAPHYDHSGVSTATACKLLRELALLLAC